MSGKTKIVVLHMKEVIYTIVFVALAIVMAVLLFFMFGSKEKESATTSASLYKPGVYTSSVELSNNSFDVEVTVDADSIKSVRMVNLSESTTAMFPLMEPTLEELAAQIYTTQSVENIQYSEENKYTSMLLLNAVTQAIEKAKIQ